MSEIFIKLVLNSSKCTTAKGCAACVQVCPVRIFKRVDAGEVTVSEANEDECTLCDLCLQQCPSQAITLKRLY
jgi:NAD-dependent dihydropyrimidine dehydrogenase PreA subunit